MSPQHRNHRTEIVLRFQNIGYIYPIMVKLYAFEWCRFFLNVWGKFMFMEMHLKDRSLKGQKYYLLNYRNVKAYQQCHTKSQAVQACPFDYATSYSAILRRLSTRDILNTDLTTRFIFETVSHTTCWTLEIVPLTLKLIRHCLLWVKVKPYKFVLEYHHLKYLILMEFYNYYIYNILTSGTTNRNGNRLGQAKFLLKQIRHIF